MGNYVTKKKTSKMLETEERKRRKHIGRAIFYCDQEDYEKALLEYQKALMINSLDDVLWNSIGDVYDHLHELNSARECYQIAVELDPKNSNAWFNLGQVHPKREAAIKCFEKAITVDPQYVDAWWSLAREYSLKNKNEKAINCFSKLVKSIPYNPYAWNDMAISYTHLEEHEKAIECYEKALETDPHECHLWYNMGLSYKKLGQHTMMINCFEKALELSPENDAIKYDIEKILETPSYRNKDNKEEEDDWWGIPIYI